MENQRTNTLDPTSVSFTEWQVKIMRYWGNTDTVQDAADQLKISLHTLQTHLKRMRRKVGVKRTFDVYLYLMRKGDL